MSLTYTISDKLMNEELIYKYRLTPNRVSVLIHAIVVGGARRLQEEGGGYLGMRKSGL